MTLQQFPIINSILAVCNGREPSGMTTNFASHFSYANFIEHKTRINLSFDKEIVEVPLDVYWIYLWKTYDQLFAMLREEGEKNNWKPYEWTEEEDKVLCVLDSSIENISCQIPEYKENKDQ